MIVFLAVFLAIQYAVFVDILIYDSMNSIKTFESKTEAIVSAIPLGIYLWLLYKAYQVVKDFFNQY